MPNKANNQIIGSSIPMIDAKEKLMGKAVYAADVEMPGMLVGKVLRSPHAHARIVSLDTREAESLPGVYAVVTHKDTAPGLIGFSQYNDHSIFAIDRVRFVGDEVAAVAAEDALTAERALGLIRVVYEELPCVLSMEEALAPGASLVHDGFAGNIAHQIAYERGDIDNAWKDCAAIVEETFTTSPAHPAYIEPQACVAAFDAYGNADIYASTQSPSGSIREKTAMVLGLPIGRIRVHQTFVGGGFGGKVWQHIIPLTAVLARKARRPVKVIYTRREDLAYVPVRVPFQLKLKMGADKTGRILAKETQILADNGAYSINAPVVLDTAATRIESLYCFENIRTSAKLVYTNKLPSGTFRGFGNPQGTFMVESAMDMLAEKLNMDPAQIRIRNAPCPGHVSAHGWKMGSCELVQCIEKAAEISDWKRKKSEKRFGHGIGMSCVIHVNGNRSVFPAFDGSNAYIDMNEDGDIFVMCSDGDIGQGASTVFAQLAAKTIGLPLEKVRVQRADTDYSGFAFGAFASRITLNGGNAVRDAALKIRAAVLESAAEMAGKPSAEGFDIADGIVTGPDGWSNSVGAVALNYIYTHSGSHLRREGTYSPPGVVMADKKNKYGNISAAYSFAAHVAEVEVDRETGKVNLLGYWAVHDAGKIINPMLAEGQIEGGVVQGIGYALYENYHYGKDGRVLNNSFLDYKIPTSLDVPKIVCGFAESDEPNGPLGAKGLGEPTIVPVPAAIGNALYDALGVRINDMPFTAEKVKGVLDMIAGES